MSLLSLTRIAEKWGEFRISLQVTLLLMYIQDAPILISTLTQTLLLPDRKDKIKKEQDWSNFGWKLVLSLA